MSITNLPTPDNTMGEAIDKLGYAGDHLDSGRHALAQIMDELPQGAGPISVIECVILTLFQAAEELKAGLDVIQDHHALPTPGARSS